MTSAILLILESALWIFPKLDKKSHQVENTTMAGSYTNKSYGIHVAKLAGMPQDVVDRSKEILSNLEEGELGESGQPKIAKTRKKKDDAGSQLAFF